MTDTQLGRHSDSDIDMEDAQECSRGEPVRKPLLLEKLSNSIVAGRVDTIQGGKPRLLGLENLISYYQEVSKHRYESRSCRVFKRRTRLHLKPPHLPTATGSGGDTLSDVVPGDETSFQIQTQPTKASLHLLLI